MQKNKILTLLAVFVILINYQNYFQKDTAKQLRDISAIQKRITAEEKMLQEEVLVSDANISRYFLPEDVPQSIAMAKLQKKIKMLAVRYELKVKSLDWGEVLAPDDTWYKVLPINLNLEGYPEDFRQFMNALHEDEKLYYIDALMITRDRRRAILRFKLRIKGYQLKGSDV